MNSVLFYLYGDLFTGPYSSVWPLLVLPPSAAMLIWAAMKSIGKTPFAPQSQMWVGGIAACIPGLVTLGLLDFSIHYIPRISPEDFGCYVKIYGPLSIVAVLSARAGILLYLRNRRLSELCRLAVEPSERLGRIARELDIPVSEIPVNTPICMMAGWLHPRVLISTGALESFSDDDLRAALLHERAHLRRGDTRWSVLIYFLSELGAWPVKTALSIYRQGREALADRDAASFLGGPAFAGVLVRFARNSLTLPFAEALAEEDGLEQRVRRLLDASASERLGWISRIVLSLALLAAGALTLYAQWARGVASSLFRCMP
jgi:beta-lactamase regulating signal transducer with metallopeptidase domain